MSSLKKPHKQTIFIATTIFLFFFFAPFYHTPGGREDLLETGYSEFTYPDGTEISVWEYHEDATWPCDGSCIYYDTTWAPFGALVRNHSKNAFYVTPLWKIEIEDTSKLGFIAPPLSTQSPR